jgi:hypothetical protein
LFLLGFTPRVFYTYVTVDDSHVEGDDRALWFLADPKKQFNISLMDVTSIEDRTKRERSGARMKNVSYLVLHRSDGGETELLLTSLLSAARPRIEEAVNARKNAAPIAGQSRSAEPPAAVADPPPEASAAQPPSPVSTEQDNVPPPAPKNSPPATGVASDPPAPDTQTTRDDLKVGMPVEAHWGSKWWPGRVVQLMPDGQVKFHYDGWNDAHDEVLPRTRLRPVQGGTSSTSGSPTTGTTSGNSAGPVTADTVLQKDQRLQTQWGSKWWDSKVLEVLADGKVKVHYEGWSDGFDEVVPRERLRFPANSK